MWIRSKKEEVHLVAETVYPKVGISPVAGALFGIYSLLLLSIYYSAFVVMVAWWNRDDYNYCYLIPFVVIYLIWERKKPLFEVPSPSSWMGALPFLAGILLYWLGELGGEFYTLYWSSWLVMVGLCWLHLGWDKIKLIGFPLIIVLTMFPLPNFIQWNASLKLQLISSQLGTALIRLYGLSAYRDGNVIDLGFTQLQVVEACSGLRYLIPLLVIGLILVYFFKAPWWKRLLLLVSTVPWAIVVNAFRIALTGILASYWGMGVIEGFSHDFAGWAVFMVSLGVLLGEMWLLGKMGARGEREQNPVAVPPETVAAEAIPDQEEEKSRGREGAYHKPSWLPKAVFAVLILALTLGLSHGVEFREKIPAQKPLTQFPLEVGEWRGKLQFMSSDILRGLPLSDYVMIDYLGPNGKMLDFYVAYYESQRKGKSIHTPDTCLPGAGWVFEKAELISFPTPGENGGTTTVNRAFITKMNMRQLVYYWFPQRGRILHNLYEMKFYAFWDALTQQRTDGALVRLITPLTELEPTDQADQRLQQFTRQLLPLLAEYLPGKQVN